MSTALNTIISFIVGGTLTWVVSYRKKLKLQNTALLNLLKNQLTEIYYKYDQEKAIPDYVYCNFLDMLEVYENLDGNSYIHTIAKKMESWDIIKTDILQAA